MPRHGVVLDSPPEAVYKRKPEFSVEMFRKQRGLYQQMARALGYPVVHLLEVLVRFRKPKEDIGQSAVTLLFVFSRLLQHIKRHAIGIGQNAFGRHVGRL